jgi:uncharacterized protein
MKRLRPLLHPSSFILLIVLMTAIPMAALEVPPTPTQWVTDAAGILGGTEEDLLNRKLEQFEKDSGAQFIIYTFPSIETESIEDFTIRCVERWKVGRKGYDNGLVLFVFAKERKIRFEVGYGLEGTITDAYSSQVTRELMAPHFQKGDYAGGMLAAVDAITAKIKKNEAPVPPVQGRDSGQQRASGDSFGVIPMLIVLFVVFFVIVPMLSRRRSGCGGCILPFLMSGGGTTFGGGGGFSGGGFGGGGGGFSGGGGSFGGGGSTGGW